jgi:type 1 glutamine amidotransferase
LLAVHTSVISFEDSTTWANWVGGSWNWGVSNHPQPGDVQVAPCASHPIVDGVEPFVVHDERYMHVSRAEDAEVLTESIGADGNQASMWALAKDGSRSVYSALGHDQLSFSHPTHQLLLRRAAAWVVGEADEQVRSIKS